MPAAVGDLTDAYLYAEYHKALKGSVGQDVPYQFDVSYTIRVLKQRMRDLDLIYNREDPAPPPMLELWHFTLRRYLNLRFKSGTFWMPHSILTYSESI